LLRELFIRLEHEGAAQRCRTAIVFEGLPRFEPGRIVYEITGPDAPEQAPNANFALAASLPTAMSLGRPLHVRGEVDADFLATMEEYMAAWCRWRPDLFQPVAISADVETAARPRVAAGSIMAFSGGLDSTFALHAHKHAMLGRRQQDIQAAVLVQGFDIPLDWKQAFNIARGHVKAILDSYGVRLNIVRTNWQKPFSVKWGMTHVLGIAAVLHLFHRQLGSGVIADDLPYDTQVTPWSSNAITNQMLGCSGFPIRTTGAGWSRTQKARAVAANPVVLDHLRVCYERPELGGNCGECEKCFRTKLNFYASGIPRIPAVGNPVTVADATRMIPRHGAYLYRYTEALSRGTWPNNDPIRAEVEQLARRLGAERNGSAHGRRSVQHARKKTRKVMRAIGSVLNSINRHRGRPASNI
jgi:7-cyano-7-deazaguanine synthase in queuosine biosynthesis